MIYIERGGSLAVEATCATVAEAVVLCRSLEVSAADGYCRNAWEEGRLVADAEGPVLQYGMSAYERAERAGDAS